jgi:hypothetical protein
MRLVYLEHEQKSRKSCWRSKPSKQGQDVEKKKQTPLKKGLVYIIGPPPPLFAFVFFPLSFTLPFSYFSRSIIMDNNTMNCHHHQQRLEFQVPNNSSSLLATKQGGNAFLPMVVFHVVGA